MKRPTPSQHGWLLILIGSLIPLTLILGNEFHIAPQITIPIVMVSALVLGAMAIWIRANAYATGDEWWQDDTSSGWRGK